MDQDKYILQFLLEIRKVMIIIFLVAKLSFIILRIAKEFSFSKKGLCDYIQFYQELLLSK